MHKLLTLAFGVLFLLATVPAQASIKTDLANVPTDGFVSFVTGAVDPSGGNSGFLGTIYDNGMNALESWETFCVETGAHAETINLNGTKYNIHSTDIDTASATNNHVTDEAKWVYYAFGEGLLTGWTANKGEEVQEAIWSLVEGNSIANNWLVTANGDAATWRAQAIAAVSGGWGDADRVRVINPTNTGNGNHRQSMLYIIPEPFSLSVWGGLMAVVGIRRRRRLI